MNTNQPKPLAPLLWLVLYFASLALIFALGGLLGNLAAKWL